MLKLGKLRVGVASFLDIAVRTVIERLHDDLLTAAPGEEDERDILEVLPHLLQEFNAVHLRHLVVGDDGIAALFSEQVQGFPGGGDSLYGEGTRALEK